MAKMTTEELLSVFEEMSVLELKEFLDSFEEKFDVTAAAPVAATRPEENREPITATVSEERAYLKEDNRK